ncbi:MAG TPA: ABC transporter permease [Thermoplasmata archaeon]|jgi:peptide/nickel transport system permease protein|nr:ABC transporter permease [Thermoplasmata archaeon]
MRLRTFLLRRSIHTVITLVIVLVLLFVIFRLMPGDPTRFFIRPGQTDADRRALLVEFGFAKEVPAPGHGYRTFFPTPDDGVYEIAIEVNDTRSRTQDFWFYHVKQLSRLAAGTGPVVNVTATAANGDALWDIGPQENVTIAALLARPPGGVSFNATMEITQGGTAVVVPTTMVEDVPEGTTAHATWAPPSVGAYSVTVTFTPETAGNSYVGYAGVAANIPDPAPFALVASERHLSTAWESERFDTATVTINVTSAGAGIASLIAAIRSPIGETDSRIMIHPTDVVENNLAEEFWAYMTAMLQGDFGKSLYTRQPVWDEIARRVGPSLLLFGSSVIISYLLGILIGAVLAWRRGSKMELSSIVVSLFFYSMPVFWFGLILLWAFAFTWKIFPLAGYADLEAVQAGGITYVLNVLKHMALPLLNLVILGLAGHVLLMRNSMLEVMGEDYITTAKAKGLSERRIMYRHAARNAMLPVVTAFALSISGTISGGVLTETIFSWPGMGAFLVTSTIAQDFPSVQGAFFLLAVLTIMANLIADILYAYLDPRVRL